MYKRSFTVLLNIKKGIYTDIQFYKTSNSEIPYNSLERKNK